MSGGKMDMAPVDKMTTDAGGMECSLGLDFGTESVRALVVRCSDGAKVSEAVTPYPHGVITSALPPVAAGCEAAPVPLPPEFALQHPDDYMNSSVIAIREVMAAAASSLPHSIVGIGVAFTACTMLPVLKDGTPLMQLPKFASNPHAWVKLWKHHGAQPEANKVNQTAANRQEPFRKYCSGLVSSEWMLPKCWEICNHAPDVYDAADYFVDGGDWLVFQLTGRWSRNLCVAGYKGLWSAELGFPSQLFLAALDPKLRNLKSKWITDIVAPGHRAGFLCESFASSCGLQQGIAVSAASVDAHCGVVGMGVCSEGPLSLAMGTSTCHMALCRELHVFDGYAAVVKDGILPGFFGYESGQSAVGDIFSWFAKIFMGGGDDGGGDGFDTLTAKAAALQPGECGLLALDWHNGARSVLMDSSLSGVVLGLTLTTKPEHVYRALIEATAFGTKCIVDVHRDNGIPFTELVCCGGLTKQPLIMQIYADVVGLPVRVAASSQAVALGAAIFGAAAASDDGVVIVDIVRRMTMPPSASFAPNSAATRVYATLYALYRRVHDLFGRENVEIMRQLKQLSSNATSTSAAVA